MIKIEDQDTYGWLAAIRGMRNPFESWDKIDTHFEDCWYPGWGVDTDGYLIGDNDLDLMRRLAKAGKDHRKFMRMLVVTCDITAPLYWWKEFDTYKVGTVANSCSTMHKIAAKEFTLDDFSHEHLFNLSGEFDIFGYTDTLNHIVDGLNFARKEYIRTKEKDWWWQMIQLLPSSFNQKRTVMLNYEVLANMYFARKDHKLDEWRDFCKWVENLPHFAEILGIEVEPLEDKDE